MPLPFNRYPRGLLGLLDAKTQGRTPQDLEDAVRATVDVRDLYVASFREQLNGATAALTIPGFFPATASALLVPQDEIWLIESVHINQSGLVLQAGTTIGLSPGFRVVNSGLPGQALGPMQVFTVGDLIHAPYDRPFLALPSYELGIACSRSILGTAPATSVTATFTRLRI